MHQLSVVEIIVLGGGRNNVVNDTISVIVGVRATQFLKDIHLSVVVLEIQVMVPLH
jgi:hypothetical protein